MFTNYLKITFRNLIKHKGYSFINIAGLAVGMAVCILIILWIQNELNYDRFHKNADRIHLLVSHQQLETGVQSLPTQVATVGPLLKEKLPEVEDFVRIFTPEMITLSYGEKTFQENPYFVDKSFPAIFSFSAVEGNINSAFNEPYSIVLTKRLAERYFGEENPIGKVMTSEGSDNLMVTAVIENPPDNTEFEYKCLMPIEIMSEVGYNLDEPGGADFYTVLLLREGSNPIETNRKINSVLSDYFGQMENSEYPCTFSLNPITKWHLYSFTGTGNRYQYIYIFAAVAMFILLIACMNFVNLSTARSITRVKEIGLRKVIGANRFQLVRHLLGEYLLIAIISAIIAIGIAELLLPVFNGYAGKTLVISYTNTTLIVGLIGIVTITGILAGIFPALYLSAFQPVTIMRGLLKSGKGGIQFRRILVVLQFTLSLILIVGTIVISTQINYMKDKDIGVNKANVLYVIPTSGIMRHISSFKQSLLENPNITSVSVAAQWLPHINSTIGQNFDYEGKDPNLKLELHFDWVSLDYTKTLGLEMADGRFYSQDFPTDLSEGVVLNQTAVNRMGIENPIGKRFSYWGKDYRIIGVLKDFHLEPLYETLKPMILIYADFERWSFGHLYIKVNPDNISETIAYIETVYKSFEPTGQFSYTFLDESYDRLYRSEYRFGDMAKYATGLAIFIACLGLFGMASFTTERRTKEIGIRKVLGATVSGIIGLLTKEFVILVIVAGVVASPVAFLVMNKWLNHFAYHTDIGIWMFVLACVIALVITMLTICYQAIKAAIANPVDALRYE